MKLKTIEDRRKTDRERLKRWRKNKLAKGNKQIQLMLTPEAQEVLKAEKARTGEPYVRIINRAIVGLKESLHITTDRAGREREQKAIRDMIIKMEREGKSHSQISRHLNGKGVPTLSGTGKWHPSTIRNFLLREKEKMDDK